jgi:hypothetical protein
MALPSKKIIYSIIDDKRNVQLLATQNYPSRGQTTTQELYPMAKGKIFLKRVSKRNHDDCRISIADGTLAEREFWAFRLARYLGVHVPDMALLDEVTTVQEWLDYPDACQFASSQSAMKLNAANVFDCAMFDWLTGQVDRHNANYLYNYADQEIILIDSAHSFLKYSGSLPHYLEIFEVGNKSQLNQVFKSNVYENILDLKQQKLFSMVSLRNAEEKVALLKRWKKLTGIKTIAALIKLFRESKI